VLLCRLVWPEQIPVFPAVMAVFTVWGYLEHNAEFDC
jgi:hypothetical protein